MSKKISFIFKIAFLLVLLFLAFVLGGSYVTWIQQRQIVAQSLQDYKNQINRFQDGIRPEPVQILDKNKTLIGEFYLNPFEPVRTDNLKNYQVFIWAVLSMEDEHFYHHSGINWSAILRAILVNLSKFRISQGGSTITQQLAKLIMGNEDRNLFNKLTEVYATYYIESQLTKDEILSVYLNKIFLGRGNYGIEAASWYYFNKPGEELTPAEAAMITGLIPAPSIYNPVDNLGIALARQRLALLAMARNRYPDQRPKSYQNLEKFQKSIDSQIKEFRKQYKIKEISEEGRPIRYDSSIAERGYDRNFTLNLTPDFNSDIREYIQKNYVPYYSDLESYAITIYTTLDYEKQKIAEESLKQGISDIRKNIESLAKPSAKSKPLDPNIVGEISSGMRAGFVSLEPSTGNVEVFISNLRISSSYRPNRIESSYRQPGSTIKPLLYTMVFQNRRYHQSSIVTDEKIEYDGYSPKNWYAGFNGDMTVRKSLALSVNTIPVKFLYEIGIERFIMKLSEIINITPQKEKERFPRNLTLALGSGELTPMELAIIYATIQNGGRKITPRKLQKIVLKNTDNEQIEEFNFREDESYLVLDPVACAMTLDILQAVLTEEGTMPVKMNPENRFPIAGKTGTVQSPKEARKRWGNISGIRDAWFAGMFPGLTSVVWIGNEWGAPFPGSGSGTSGKAWWRFADAYSRIQPLQEMNLIPYPVEGKYVLMDICTDDGTILETDWEKPYLEIPPKISNETQGPVEKVPNPNFCRLPALKQYFYVGELPPRREVQKLSMNDKRKESNEAEASSGETEITRIDVSEKLQTNPELENGAPLPVREATVELKESYYHEPDPRDIVE